MFTADRSVLENLNMDTIKYYIQEHKQEFDRLKKLESYYKGSITDDNDIHCNHAAEIADNATGYFMGNSITYTEVEGQESEKSGLTVVKEWFDECDIDSVDDDLALNLSIFGKAYEMIVPSESDEPRPESFSIEPEYAFVVYDDTLRHKSLFGVYYLKTFDARGSHNGYRVYVFTGNLLYEAKCDIGFSGTLEVIDEHYFGEVPIIEFQNNKYKMGDFETVLTLIDAYNQVMSIRLKDKKQFIDALLVLTNYVLGDNRDEVTETMETLRELKVLELGPDGKAEYLTRNLDEAGVEILRKAIESDIHKLSRVPCLTDENFVGNSSGVALEYKLLGLENLCKTKEKYYRKGLKIRLKCYENFMRIKNGKQLGKTNIQFSRGLPKNVYELAQIVSMLSGKVSNETLIALLPFVKDAAAELKKMQEENDYKDKEEPIDSDWNEEP